MQHDRSYKPGNVALLSDILWSVRRPPFVGAHWLRQDFVGVGAVGHETKRNKIIGVNTTRYYEIHAINSDAIIGLYIIFWDRQS